MANYLSFHKSACRHRTAGNIVLNSSLNSYCTSLAECGVGVVSANILGQAPAALALLALGSEHLEGGLALGLLHRNSGYDQDVLQLGSKLLVASEVSLAALDQDLSLKRLTDSLGISCVLKHLVYAKSGVVAKFRQAVLSLPSAVRLILITPLWALGTALMTAVTFLWNIIFASPLGAFIASFAVGFAVLFGLFAVTAKMLFPNVPLRKLLSKRNILVLGIAALLLSVIDWLAPTYWQQYPIYAAAVKFGIAAFVIGVMAYRIKKILHRDKYENMPAPAV